MRVRSQSDRSIERITCVCGAWRRGLVIDRSTRSERTWPPPLLPRTSREGDVEHVPFGTGPPSCLSFAPPQNPTQCSQATDSSTNIHSHRSATVNPTPLHPVQAIDHGDHAPAPQQRGGAAARGEGQGTMPACLPLDGMSITLEASRAPPTPPPTTPTHSKRPSRRAPSPRSPRPPRCRRPTRSWRRAWSSSSPRSVWVLGFGFGCVSRSDGRP